MKFTCASTASSSGVRCSLSFSPPLSPPLPLNWGVGLMRHTYKTIMQQCNTIQQRTMSTSWPRLSRRYLLQCVCLLGGGGGCGGGGAFACVPARPKVIYHLALVRPKVVCLLILVGGEGGGEARETGVRVSSDSHELMPTSFFKLSRSYSCQSGRR